MHEGSAYFSFNRAEHWAKGITCPSDHLEFSEDAMHLLQKKRFVQVEEFDLPVLPDGNNPIAFSVQQKGTVYLLTGDGGVWRYAYQANATTKLCTLDKFSEDFPSGSVILEMACIEGEQGRVYINGKEKQAVYNTLGRVVTSAGQLNWLALVAQPPHVFLLKPGVSTLETKDSELRQRNERRVEKISPDVSEPQLCGVVYEEEIYTDPPTPLSYQHYLLAGMSGNMPYVVNTRTPNVLVDAREWEGAYLERQYLADFSSESQALIERIPFLEQTSTQNIRMVFFGGECYVLDLLNHKLSILTLRTVVPDVLPDQKTEVDWTICLDSTERGQAWHKVTLDAEIPAGTGLSIFYYATDEKLAQAPSEWQKSPTIVSARDVLLWGAKGQFLWLRLRWQGTRESSPAVRWLRVYYERYDYLSRLPAIYREDPQSRDFLERFLALFGTFLEEQEEAIYYISRYFDAESTPDSYLRWLGGWIGVNAQGDWSAEQVRQLIERSPELYAKRGTKQTLAEMIRLYTGERPEILEEKYDKSNWPSECVEENSDVKCEGADFYVLLSKSAAPTEAQQATVRRIIDQEKPAFATGKLILFEPMEPQAADQASISS